MNRIQKSRVSLLLSLVLVLGVSYQSVFGRFATFPSGFYTVQGCHMCSQDSEIFCCRCPKVLYERAFPFTDLLKEKREVISAKKNEIYGPATDFKNVSLKKIENIYAEWLHRSLGYATICIPTIYSRQCDGQLTLCGDKLVCGSELDKYHAAGYC